MRGLGNVQRDVLAALIEYKEWRKDCHWLYSTPSRTKKVLDSLVKRGLVRNEEGFYTPIKDEFSNPVHSTVTRD